MQIVFKIRRGDGLFSNGRPYPTFVKSGKVWRRRCDLNAHINLIRKKYQPAPETRWCKWMPPRLTGPWPYADASIVPCLLDLCAPEAIAQP